MRESTKFNLLDAATADEHLHINLGKGKINGLLNALKFVDKSTLQYVTYIPSLELSGYGETEAQAMEMLKFSLDDFGNYISALSQNEIKAELVKLGWHKTMFNKDFSKSYVDTKMLKFSLDDFGNYISALSQNEIKAELVKLGWHKTMFNKDFSKSYVDTKGQLLQQLNAVDDKVELLTLQAA